MCGFSRYAAVCALRVREHDDNAKPDADKDADPYANGNTGCIARPGQG